jgi:cyclopropane-fatty-acyl-phospholipid synthase
MELREASSSSTNEERPRSRLSLVRSALVPPRPGADTAAEALQPLVEAVLCEHEPVRVEMWDGSAVGPTDGPGTLRVRSAEAFRRVLWAPGELGFARAYVAGEIDVDLDSDIFEVLRSLKKAAPLDLRNGARILPAAFTSALRLGILGPPLPPPVEEARPKGLRHSKRRDAAVVRHHYDVGNDFYRLILGPSMTYSCARFVHDNMGLAEAQAAKHDLVARKLSLHERRGTRLLDVGCGWGSMAIHAARNYGASVVGVTLSPEQAALARERVRDAGVAGNVEIRIHDYRDLRGERFDAISSIGMFEHVGRARSAEYFVTLSSLLEPGGRLLNHAISSPGGSRPGPRTFIGRYVFPDGELQDVGAVALKMQRSGLEVRDVESLREHYSETLHAWVANLEEHWNEAVRLVGLPRAKIWRLYMAGSANGFDDGGISIHQILAERPRHDGTSGMSRTRADWD